MRLADAARGRPTVSNEVVTRSDGVFGALSPKASPVTLVLDVG